MLNMLNEKEVLDFQKDWGDGIVSIGNTYNCGGDYKNESLDFINRLYAYSNENNSPSFGSHAWVQLYIDDKWLEFDPTWNETKLGVEHILLEDSDELELICVI